jgi:very-short-patch-repair endonuclease
MNVIKLSPNSHLRRKSLLKVFNEDFFNFIVENKYPFNRLSEYLKSFSIHMCAGSLFDRCNRLNIKHMSISESCYCQFTKDDKLKTCQLKYGVDNPSQAKLVKKKKERSALRKYGVKNVFQSEEIKEKSKATLMEKYGVEHIAHMDEQIEKMKNCGRHSKLQTKIEDILTKNNIEFKTEKGKIFLKFNNQFKRNYCPRVDILIPSLKLIVEVNGDIWHANPKIYKENDIIYKYEGPTKAKDIWKFDKIRKKHLESFGYKVILVWERDYHTNKQECERKLLYAIKKHEDKINKTN